LPSGGKALEKRYTVFRYIAYSLEILILYVLQGTYFVPEILGGRPVLLIPVAITIALFENEITAMFFGLSCGALLDIGTGGTIGFYTITLTLCAFVIGSIFRDYMVVNFLNAMAFCSAFIAGLITIYFLFFYVFAGWGDAGYYFVNHYISRIIYTIILSPLFYFLNKFLFKGLRDV
jgi:rod shape-determining protein MreD